MGTDYSIPLYEPSETAGKRHKNARRRERKPYEERHHGPGWRRPGEPEKYPMPKDAFWHQWDSDVLELARLFSVWFTKGELKRPLYEANIRRTQMLLGIYNWYDPTDKKLKWRLIKGWEKRLIACGIDPVTFQIKDLSRWSRAWEMMKCQYRCNIMVLEQDILNGVPAPEYRPMTWSQSLKCQTGRHYNEYGPRPRKGNELVSKSWVAQIGSRVGLGRSESDSERRERIRRAGEPKLNARPIALTEEPVST